MCNPTQSHMEPLPPHVAQPGIYQLLSYTIKTWISHIKFQVVDILVKLLGMHGDLDVRIPIEEGLVRYVGKEIWQNCDPTSERHTF